MDDNVFSDAQQLLLGYITIPPALCSAMGSFWIIRTIVTDSQRKGGLRYLIQHRDSIYYRLMLGISSVDLIYSGGLVCFGPWMAPRNIPHSTGGMGNTTTCNVAGFFLSFFLGSMAYSAALALYFLFFLGLEYPKEWIAQYMEPILHVVGWSMPLIVGIYGVTGDYMNPLTLLPGHCFVQDKPYGCSADEDVECIRGEGYELFQTIGVSGTAVFSWIIMIISMLTIVAKICQRELKTRQYTFKHHQDNTINSVGSNSGSAPISSRRDLQRTKQTWRTALFYIGAYFICFFPTVAIQIVGVTAAETRENRRLYFPLSLSVCLLNPLQGLFNFFIFMRSKSRRQQEQNPRRGSHRNSDTRVSRAGLSRLSSLVGTRGSTNLVSKYSTDGGGVVPDDMNSSRDPRSRSPSPDWPSSVGARSRSPSPVPPEQEEPLKKGETPVIFEEWSNERLEQEESEHEWDKISRTIPSSPVSSPTEDPEA